MIDEHAAFVTGASQGIGRQIAITLAEEGADVALAARNEDNLAETAEQIGDPDATLVVPTDVTDEESVESALESTVDGFGGLSLIVNNAGIAGPTKPVEEVSVEEWQKTLDVNLLGMFLCVKHGVEHLRRSGNGRIVNISSISGKRPLENRTPYTSSKMGVMGFTRTLAHELGDDDILVNTICPGPVMGDRLERVIQNQADEQGISFEEAKTEMITGDLPIEEMVPPEDIADMVVHLASEKGAHITGQDINVDSGATWY
jgi:NAD(P)-dependent dehydrogenase (short-subunit alcohol dehydrogenase family)